MKKENKIHINEVENIAKVDISGGGYEGEDIVPITERCSKCGKLSPKTYSLDTKTGKKVSYEGTSIPF